QQSNPYWRRMLSASSFDIFLNITQTVDVFRLVRQYADKAGGGSLERDDPEMLRRIPVHDHYLQPELVGKGHEAPPTPDRPLSSCNVPSLPSGALRVVTLSVRSE